MPFGGFHPDSGAPSPPGGGVSGGVTNGSGASGSGFTNYTVTTNYANYTNFWLSITNSSTNILVTVESTLSNLTYEIMTNSSLASTNWGVWQTLPASNSITPAPPFALGSNTLFFKGSLILSTGTNGLPDYWCMEYFGTLNVDPYADPDGDGLCNLDEYLLGTNPTNANSLSPLHTDAQALLLAYTNYDAHCTYQLHVTNGPDTNTVLVTMNPTLVGTNYQIYTEDQTDTTHTWRVETNFLGTNSATTVAIALDGRSLAYIGGYGEDSDGDGLPDGYEVLATLTDPYLPDTGLTGIPDGYKDPDGDGYSNLQEYYNGTNPRHFDTPAGPQGLVADFTDGGNSLTFSWQPASGPVLDYVVSAYNWTTGNWVVLATNSPTTLTCVLSNAVGYTNQGISQIAFAVQGIFAPGLSHPSYGSVPEYGVLAQAELAHGPRGQAYLLTSGMASNVTGFNASTSESGGTYPNGAYFQPSGYYPTNLGDGYETNFYIPATQFTNGVAALTDAQLPMYAFFDSSDLYPELSANASGSPWIVAGLEDRFPNVPFVDGTAQMKENIRFLLRAASGSPFGYTVYDFNPGSPPNSSSLVYPTDYVYSTYSYIWSPSDDPAVFSIDCFAPFEDNYFYRNFVFDSSLVTHMVIWRRALNHRRKAMSITN